jgi:hypothetical protein
MKVPLGIFYNLFFIVLPHVAIFCQTKDHNAYQLIISEIMADPIPKVDLPESEYVEVFNRSDSTIFLNGWSLTIGKYKRPLPPAFIKPGSYAIVCDTANVSRLTNYGALLPLENMPALTNTGQTLILKDEFDRPVHSIVYEQDWYKEPGKSEGGWSLEIIDPENPCGGSLNWRASSNIHGGTPGKINSVHARNPDLASPLLLRAALQNDSAVLLVFNEDIHYDMLTSPFYYSTNRGLLHPQSVRAKVDAPYTIELLYPEHFESSVVYTVNILEEVKDCVENPVQGNLFVNFAVPTKPISHDLILSEIMFDPSPGTSEFIELFNRSEKVLDMANISVALRDNTNGEWQQIESFKIIPFLIFPDSYTVITKDAVHLPNQCLSKYPHVIFEHHGLFSLPNNGSWVALLDEDQNILDEYYYHPSQHNPMLNNTSGVSLERCHVNTDYGISGEWRSASQICGFCTPGQSNSQSALFGDVQSALMLSSEVFSPDTDGTDDYLTITITVSSNGWIANIIVFDPWGNCIRTIASNNLLSITSEFVWDGSQDNHQQARIGLYVVYAELFDPKGEVKKFKKVVALARKF